MVIGYVLINTEMKRERDVYEHLVTKQLITDVQLLSGEFDLIAKVESEDHNALANYIIDNIRCLDGVKHTTTLAAGYSLGQCQGQGQGQVQSLPQPQF